MRGKEGIQLKIKFTKNHPDAVIPIRATSGAAGFDLTAVSAECVHPGLYRYDTGIAVEIPPGYVGLVFQRSSVYKTGLALCNAVGVIDSDYRGTISFMFRTYGLLAKPYRPGDRIGQIVFAPAPEVELEEVPELSMTERGEGGYGSTGI